MLISTFLFKLFYEENLIINIKYMLFIRIIVYTINKAKFKSYENLEIKEDEK